MDTKLPRGQPKGWLCKVHVLSNTGHAPPLYNVLLLCMTTMNDYFTLVAMVTYLHSIPGVVTYCGLPISTCVCVCVTIRLD